MRAIVLAGGEGTRMRPLTWRTPKPLVPLLNRPLLDQLLLHLRGHGFDQITLALTHRAEAVQRSFGSGERLGLSLDYAYEDTPLGSGGAIAMIAGAHTASAWDETFLVCNGDIVTDLDLTGMLEAHRAGAAELSISLYEVEDPSPFGVADLDGEGRIRRFVEKPPRELAPSKSINSGFWLFEPSLLADMDATRFNRVEDELFPNVCAQGRPVYGYAHAGTWADVGNPAALLRVNLDLARATTADGVLLGDDVTLHANATVEGPAVIEAPAVIEVPHVPEPPASLGHGVIPGQPIAAYTQEDLVSVVRWVGRDAKPRDAAAIVRDVMVELGFKRRGTKITDAITTAAASIGALSDEPVPSVADVRAIAS